MIICVGEFKEYFLMKCYYNLYLGTQGCGKTLLIKALAANDAPGSITK